MKVRNFSTTDTVRIGHGDIVGRVGWFNTDAYEVKAPLTHIDTAELARMIQEGHSWAEINAIDADRARQWGRARG